MPKRTRSVATIEALEGRLLLSSTTGSVTGSIFSDYNGNGIRDPGEPPAKNVRVTINDGLPDRYTRYAVTNNDGNFRITQVWPGNFAISTVSAEHGMTTVPNSFDVTAGHISTLPPFGVDDGWTIAIYDSDLSITTISRLGSKVGTTDIVSSPNWDLYSNAPSHNALLRIKPSGVVTRLTIPTPNTDIGLLAIDSHQNIWFTEPDANAIGSMNAAGDFSTFTLPTPYSNPFGIAADLNGVWFTERDANQICTVQNGRLSEVAIPTPNSQPTAIATDGEGVWFIESGTNKIGQYDGTFREFPLKLEQGTPQRIVQGPDGNMWFTLDNPAGIGVINTSGVVTVYPVSINDSYPVGIIDGPNGTLVFTDAGTNAIGEITTTGQVTETPTSAAYSEPIGLTLNSDGSISFVEAGVPAIALARETPSVSQSLERAQPAELLDFSDGDPAARLSNYKVTINWDDGSKSTSGSVKKKSAGIFAVMGKHRFKAAGTYTISVTVFDRAGSTLTQSVIAAITL